MSMEDPNSSSEQETPEEVAERKRGRKRGAEVIAYGDKIRKMSPSQRFDEQEHLEKKITFLDAQIEEIESKRKAGVGLTEGENIRLNSLDKDRSSQEFNLEEVYAERIRQMSSSERLVERERIEKKTELLNSEMEALQKRVKESGWHEEDKIRRDRIERDRRYLADKLRTIEDIQR